MARAIADQDATRLRALFATPVIFRAITPRRFFDAETAVEVVDEIILGRWFDPGKTVTEVIALDDERGGRRQRVSFRMAVELASGQPS